MVLKKPFRVEGGAYEEEWACGQKSGKGKRHMSVRITMKESGRMEKAIQQY